MYKYIPRAAVFVLLFIAFSLLFLPIKKVSGIDNSFHTGLTQLAFTNSILSDLVPEGRVDAPLVAPTPTENTPTQPVAAPVTSINTPVAPTPVETTPYSLTTAGVAADIAALGYSLDSLQAQGIDVIASNGRIARRCASGSSGQVTVEGMAVRSNFTYAACPSGESPLYDAYTSDSANCTVLYNKDNGSKLSILAHELAHCLHFEHGQFRGFDIEYRTVRPVVNGLGSLEMAEVIADDFVQCRHAGIANINYTYYNRYGIATPSSDQCVQINTLISSYLLNNS